MRATVEAAIISGSFGLMGISGTALVAIAGFRANRRISNESARAERDKGLWEKRCAAYEEIIGMLHDRQAYRAETLKMARAAKADGADLAAFSPIATKYANDFYDPKTRGARGRLLAYASPAVRTAYWQMIADDTAMGLTLVAWAGMLYAQQKKLHVNEEPPPDPEDLWSRFEELHKLVQERDKALSDLIRRELGSDPPPKPPPQNWHGVMAPG